MARMLRPILATAVLSATALGQCGMQWLPGTSAPGTDGSIHASVSWDHDRQESTPPVVVVAGRFTLAGSVRAWDIAMFDPATSTWSDLGGVGLYGAIDALAVLANGDLVAGGTFWMDGQPVVHVARWDGESWTALGSGIDHPYALAAAHALLPLPNGDLLVGGYFTTAGNAAATSIARWDGASWSPLGAGISGRVHAMALLANGDVVVGGMFNQAGAVAAWNVARWGGGTWTALGAGVNGAVRSIATTASGAIVVAGDLTVAGGSPAAGIAVWDGTQWSSLGAGLSQQVNALHTLPNGDLVAAGSFGVSGSVLMPRVARWNGSAWSAFGAGPRFVVRTVLELPSGDLLACGEVSEGSNMARWNGSVWTEVGAGGPGFTVTAMATLTTGEHVIAGSVMHQGLLAPEPVAMFAQVARWTGTGWSRSLSMAGGVHAMVATPGGGLVVAGTFADRLRLWDGVAWASLGPGTNGPVRALASLGNGVVLGGDFDVAGGVVARGVARWVSGGWFPLGTVDLRPVLALARLANGDIVAGGSFTTVGGTPFGNVARWNGSTWTPLGSGMSGPSPTRVQALLALPSGQLIAAGQFEFAGGVAARNIARWNGTAWVPLGAGLNHDVLALARLPGGALAAGGWFSASGGTPMAHVARWDGTTWSPIAGGTDEPVLAIAALASGELAVGGTFARAGAVASPRVARARTTCPALAVAFGSGCAGAGGVNQLAASTLPWLGESFRAVATGLAPTDLAVSVRGLGIASLPLATVLPASASGCSLLVSLDLLEVLAVSGGAAVSSLAIPLVPALVGQTLHEQVVALQLSTAAGTSTNALSLTIGSL